MFGSRLFGIFVVLAVLGLLRVNVVLGYVAERTTHAGVDDLHAVDVGCIDPSEANRR